MMFCRFVLIHLCQVSVPSTTLAHVVCVGEHHPLSCACTSIALLVFLILLLADVFLALHFSVPVTPLHLQHYGGVHLLDLLLPWFS